MQIKLLFFFFFKLKQKLQREKYLEKREWRLSARHYVIKARACVRILQERERDASVCMCVCVALGGERENLRRGKRRARWLKRRRVAIRRVQCLAMTLARTTRHSANSGRNDLLPPLIHSTHSASLSLSLAAAARRARERASHPPPISSLLLLQTGLAHTKHFLQRERETRRAPRSTTEALLLPSHYPRKIPPADFYLWMWWTMCCFCSLPYGTHTHSSKTQPARHWLRSLSPCARHTHWVFDDACARLHFFCIPLFAC